jgi:hypothetical protein
VPVAAAMVAMGVLRFERGAARRDAIVKGGVLIAAAAVPVVAWCARNFVLFGDATGSVGNRYLGWTLKPLGAMTDHPIFTVPGIAFFWTETLARFWRGEFVWGLRPIASQGWDLFYAVSSLVFIAAAMIASSTWRKSSNPAERYVLWSSLALFLLSLAFLAAISVAYDFGDCRYPSRASPYWTSGRLASGALIPFAILYLSGLDALLPKRSGDRLRWAVLIALIGLLTVSECAMSTMVFRSAYNWFHMI